MVVSNRIVHVAVGVILNAQQQILLTQRASHKPFGGMWEFPGGKIEAGESDYDGLCRELLEELNIVVKNAEFLQTFNHHYDGWQACLRVYLVRAFDGEPIGAEGQPLRWVPLRDLPSVELPPANGDIVRTLVDGL